MVVMQYFRCKNSYFIICIMRNVCNIKFVLTFSLCLPFISCKEKDQIDDANVLQVSTEKVCMKDPKDIIKEWHIIELENVPEALIPEIREMSIVDNRIYCFSNELGGYVVVFDMDGKFLFKINHRGNAQNEWIELSSFFVNKEEKFILLTDCRSKKILKYDLEGRFMESYIIGGSETMEVAMNDNLLYSVTSLLATNGNINSSNDFKVHIYNEDGKLVKKEIETLYNDLGIVQANTWNEITMSYDGKMYYTPVLSEYVYEIRNDTVRPCLKYNYKGERRLMGEDEMQQIRDKGKFIWGTDGNTFYTSEFIDSPDYIYRRMGYIEAFDILYDKKSAQTYFVQFDAPYLRERGISKQILYPAPLIYENGCYYAPFLTTTFDLPDSFIKDDMPDVLKPYLYRYRAGELNALIFTYKIAL